MQQVATIKLVEHYDYKANTSPKHFIQTQTKFSLITAFVFSNFLFSLSMENNYLEQNPLNQHIEIIERNCQTIGVKYKECQRNHAPQLGIQVVDGCGEFVLRGPPERRDDDMFCEACGCHRNFHRKVLKKKMSLVYYKDEDANLFQLHMMLSQMNNEQN